ncbi:phosphodiesterase [Atlantibacter subterranea]|jgi:diguanylate cyclase|uniref:Phosphodiesterase n=1 Tax=Atlantibacter subterraneus TaxID=255519 RepID=A0A3R9EYZ1_9ENTR|nr:MULTISPECIES: GGDEF domain-containing phosphodiesterase [Enterobacteriaceae]MDZ5667459.1 EAL domain-containing protein [Atlantibacter hermannii]MDA3132483.1 EAL domain-containing protein [Atlantibacter subterranea]MDW2743510.1 EAL domain-containing protein [Atlantibacter subterranea]RSB59136.1 phosphodiesterase [Atlantibacter subterranea]RSE03751.1 phosphodiesterase [Atlantibacter subterranea]
MPKNQEHTKLYLSEGVKLLYNNALPGILITFITSSTLAFSFLNSGNLFTKLTWWGLMMVVLIIRIIDTQLWVNADPVRKGDISWIVRFSSGCLVTATLWSAYILCFYHTFSTEEFTAAIVILSAMAGGATSVLSGNLMLSSLYNIIILLPMSVLLIFQPEQYRVNLGFLGVCFTLTMIISSMKAARYIKEAILLRYRNQTLLERMEKTIKRRTQEVYEISHIDALTGLYNRVSFLSAAEEISNRYKNNREKGFSIFFIDLDGFKNINDTLGHDIGDMVLISLSARLNDFYRQGNLICRWGGDEFIYLTTETDRHLTWQLAENMVTSLSRPILLDDQTITLGATIGIAVCPEHDTSITRLIQLADIAMYSQKGKYPERVAFYNHELEESLRRKITLNEALRYALDRNEFRAVYQPIVDGNGEIVSFEALLRWHFQGRDISPAEFIPLMEQSGRIVQIGNWIMEEACRILSEMLKLKSGISMCVNISIIQFYDKEFVDNVNNLIDRYAIPPHLLHLEVTESIIHSEQHTIYHKVSQLQKRGVKFSVDDFGTGYSSLSVIHNMNIDFIKIDRSFINNIENKGRTIVQAVKDISESLDFDVIAEGVETEKQAAILKQCGVHFMQGYYFSRPLEQGAALHILAAGQQLSPAH